jgi:mannose/fructose-specific phosphotransferase system component IIA
MTKTEICQELLNKIDHLCDQQLNQVLQFVDQVNQENNINYALTNTPEITTQEIMALTDIGGFFNFLNHELDLYILEDGKLV